AELNWEPWPRPPLVRLTLPRARVLFGFRGACQGSRRVRQCQGRSGATASGDAATLRSVFFKPRSSFAILQDIPGLFDSVRGQSSLTLEQHWAAPWLVKMGTTGD